MDGLLTDVLTRTTDYNSTDSQRVLLIRFIRKNEYCFTQGRRRDAEQRWNRSIQYWACQDPAKYNNQAIDYISISWMWSNHDQTDRQSLCTVIRLSSQTDIHRVIHRRCGFFNSAIQCKKNRRMAPVEGERVLTHSYSIHWRRKQFANINAFILPFLYVIDYNAQTAVSPGSPRYKSVIFSDILPTCHQPASSHENILST